MEQPASAGIRMGLQPLDREAPLKPAEQPQSPPQPTGSSRWQTQKPAEGRHADTAPNNNFQNNNFPNDNHENPMTDEPFLTLTNVCKGYGVAGQRTEVLHNINLEVRRGEFLAIVGYSGAGKTTLISMIAGLLHPDSGRIELHGREIVEPGPDRGVVFQNYSLLPWLTVYDNILLAVEPRSVRTSKSSSRWST
jgi:ABC-type glutathione transport system ATPase component